MPNLPCPNCKQTDIGQIGEYPCPSCGLDTVYDHVSTITGHAVPISAETVAQLQS